MRVPERADLEDAMVATFADGAEVQVPQVTVADYKNMQEAKPERSRSGAISWRCIKSPGEHLWLTQRADRGNIMVLYEDAIQILVVRVCLSVRSTGTTRRAPRTR